MPRGVTGAERSSRCKESENTLIITSRVSSNVDGQISEVKIVNPNCLFHPYICVGHPCYCFVLFRYEDNKRCLKQCLKCFYFISLHSLFWMRIGHLHEKMWVNLMSGYLGDVKNLKVKDVIFLNTIHVMSIITVNLDVISRNSFKGKTWLSESNCLGAGFFFSKTRLLVFKETFKTHKRLKWTLFNDWTKQYANFAFDVRTDKQL